MAIEWNGIQREKFQRILQKFFIDLVELEMFVSYKLDKNLSEITGEVKLGSVVFELLKWSNSQRGCGLDELLSKFCEESRRSKTSVLAELQSQPLIPIVVKIPREEWEDLFGMLNSTRDVAYIQIAFREALTVVYGNNSLEVWLDDSPMNSLSEMQDFLTRRDNSTLAVRFVECLIAQFQRSDEFQGRDLSALEAWRDRITEQFQVPPAEPIPSQTPDCHAYLLVALEESGSDVTVHPELRITGIKNPVRFGASLPKTSISINQVADWISMWICEAEEFISTDICDNAKVTLEVFLPAKYLEEDIATNWIVQDKRGEKFSLGKYRLFVVRSTDRIGDRSIQKTLGQRWPKLKSFVQAGNACQKFHVQANLPQEKGDLLAKLDDDEAHGLKFLAQLPMDSLQRIGLFNEIIDAAIPIALWSSEMADVDAVSIKAEFDTLLRQADPTNFVALAKQWREQRRSSPAAKYIKLLCDQPDRLPRLPDLKNREDDDAIVAC